MLSQLKSVTSSWVEQLRGWSSFLGGAAVYRCINRLRKNSDFDFVLKGRGFSRAVTASKSIRLYSLLKNSEMSGLPWKSGPSAPRKPLKIGSGFSPPGRLFSRPSEFFSKLFSPEVQVAFRIWT